MEVSILRTAPGVSRARRVLFPALLSVATLISVLGSHSAAAYTLFRVSATASVRLDPDDIIQGGAALAPGADQSFGQGTFPVELSDFNQPLDVNLTGSLSGDSLSTRLVSDLAFAIRLNRQERRDCLNDSDFVIQLQAADGPIASGEPGGGTIQITTFEPVFRGGLGGGCPVLLVYGFTLDIELDSAVAAGAYSGLAEISVQPVGGGQLETSQITLEVDVPSMMLLYHPDRVEIDLRATAIAALFGATSSCGSGGCLDLGARRMRVSNLNQPIPLDVAAALPAVNTLQTITLRNAVGARATGCSGNSYSDASYQIVAATGGIQTGSGTVAGLVGAPCGLDFRAGDLSFDLDLAQAAGSNASATIQVTVTGI